MNIVGLDITQIVDLGTSVAQAGALPAIADSDMIFDFIIGIVYLVYALDPDGG